MLYPVALATLDRFGAEVIVFDNKGLEFFRNWARILSLSILWSAVLKY